MAELQGEATRRLSNAVILLLISSTHRTCIGKNYILDYNIALSCDGQKEAKKVFPKITRISPPAIAFSWISKILIYSIMKVSKFQHEESTWTEPKWNQTELFSVPSFLHLILLGAPTRLKQKAKQSQAIHPALHVQG